MTQEELDVVQKSIDYQFNNLDLLKQAFVRRSYSAEKGGGDNELLEFIGDKVLDLVVVKYLTERYGSFASDCDYEEFYSNYDEGDLTEMKADLVQKKMLSHRIELLGFADYLIVGKSDEKNNVRDNNSAKEDLFEAILGAVALDCNWHLPTLEHVVWNMLEPEAELDEVEDEKNYIKLVQEWAIGHDGELPGYRIELNRSYGFYNSGICCSYICGTTEIAKWAMKKYHCYLSLNGLDKEVIGCGDSEKEARKNAAQNAYEYLKKNNLLRTIRDELDNPNKEESIGQLEILARRGYFSLPTYDFSQNHDKDGNPVWECTCRVAQYKKTTYGTSSSKKDAKKIAAFSMLNYILDEG